jgi:hypothetical protein
MVLIFFCPFFFSLLNPPHPSPNDHGLYTLTLIKCNTICPKIYVIKVSYVINHYPMKAYVTKVCVTNSNLVY